MRINFKQALFTFATFALLVLATCLMRTDAQALGTSSLVAVPALTVGNRVFTDVSTNLIQLVCYATAAAGQCTFRKQNGTTGYTPSGSKDFYILAAREVVDVAGASGFCRLSYSDNDKGVKTATAPTNPVYYGGAADNSAQVGATHAVAGAIAEQAIGGGTGFKVLNTKYPGVTCDTAAWVTVYGYER